MFDDPHTKERREKKEVPGICWPRWRNRPDSNRHRPRNARNGLAIRGSTIMLTVPYVADSKANRKLICQCFLTQKVFWRRVEDSNPQDPITDVHVGFLDR